MRNLAAIFILAGCSASVHPNPTPPPGDSDPLEATISDLVHQLESDLMDERQAAASKLVRLGHAVIPSLRRKSQEAPPALQNELSVVIESIRYTDFLFMVRPEPWSITASLENTGIVEAHRELFGRKPLHPPLDIGLKRPFGDRALVLPSFTLKSASYWKAVIAFTKAYSVHLESFAGGRGRFEEGEGSPWSEPHGPCIVSTEVHGNDKPELIIGLHLEPGFQPILGSIRNLKLRLSDGTLQELPEMEVGSKFTGGVLTKDRTIPTACEYEIPLSTKAAFVSVSGRASVVLPTKVEGIAWTEKEWQTQPTQVLAGCQITLKDWRLTIASLPTVRENPVPGHDYADRAWVFLSDDSGRTSNNRSFGLFGTGRSESGGSSGWPHDSEYRRVCVIRPLDAEAIEFDFEIKDIPLPKRRED